MTDLSNIYPSKSYHGGGRISSPKLRASLEQSQDFMGLEEDTNRYDLLLLVKRVGKAAGFTTRMINLLDYYMAFTRDCDWEEGSSPIIYQSLSKTALDLGVSERQIQRLEQSLFDIGALTWNDSGNHRRYGQRCPDTGSILFAYGVDLTPLAYLKAELQAKLAEKKARDQDWMETKRQISWYRRQIRAMLAELYDVEDGSQTEQRELIKLEKDYDAIAVAIRTHMDVVRLKELLAKHHDLHEQTIGTLKSVHLIQERAVNDSKESIMTHKMSSKDDTDVINYKYTNQKPSNKLDTSKASPKCFQESSSDGRGCPEKGKGSAKALSHSEKKEAVGPEEGEALILQTGLQHITLKQALNVATDRFKAYLPLEPRPMNWQDMVESAYSLRKELNISQNSWSHACVTLGRTGAAICVLLTDHATSRAEDPVNKPAGYFNAMINRAKIGDLHLHNSIFGILKRETEQ